MKQSILYTTFLLFALFGCDLFAQTTSTDYFVPTSQTRSAMNPAFRPKQGYIGVPFLSNIYIGAETNTANLEHFTFTKGGELVTFLHPEVGVNEFLSGLDDNNYISATMAYKLLSAGFYSGNDKFWTIDVGLRTDLGMNAPKDMFAFLKKGFSANEDNYNNGPIKYNLKDLNGSATVFSEIAVGHSRPLLDNALLVGAKAKMLLGIGNFDLNVDNLEVASTPDQWTVRGKATLQGSFPGLVADYDEDGDFDSFDIDGFGLAGFGLGFDLGAVYDLGHLSDKIDVENEKLSEIMKKAKISMAFTDIGFISWNKNSTVKFETDVIDKTLPNKDYNDGDSFYDRMDDMITDFENILDLKEENERKSGRTTALSTNMNIGLEYEFWEKNMTAGLLSSTRFGKYKTVSELTLSANYNPNRGWFASSFSYSFVRSQFKTFGLAVHLAPSKGMNFFLASDYIIPHTNSTFIPTTMKGINFQFGLTIPMGAVRNN